MKWEHSMKRRITCVTMKCKCIAGCGCDGEKGDDDNRLKKCKCDICDICKEVTEVYSCENPSDNSSCD
jgi:hypothetical protein